MADTWRPPRDCEHYWEEWTYCKSLKNRFHHYYTHGGTPACQQWRADYTACREWEKKRSPAAKEALVQSEMARQKERLKNNPVWTMRKRPPVDWHLPLERDKPQQEDSWN
ncbi:synaptic plasticity regulator PANTS isoform X2 [Dendrobates tinctorius]|uniref:synaptic plasticity regulator PANTS isoform X2 n=1 Tax=Dendrobates tinctorius TaxID=92724 RepID=UPI003CC922B6